MVQSIGTIVSPTKPSDMLVNAEEVINQRFVNITQPKLVDFHPLGQQFLRHLTFPYSVLQVQPLYWEIDKCVNLVPQRAAIAESLQVDDEDVGGLPEVEFLGSLLMFLASRTIPKIVLAKLFLLVTMSITAF
jgi:hypothetical protein